MIEYVLLLSAVALAVLSMHPRNLMKAVIVGTGIEGIALAFIYQRMLAPDVAMAQAIICSTMLPALFAIAVYKTQRTEE
jgi:energy-converting hydrogenase B subunit D